MLIAHHRITSILSLLALLLGLTLTDPASASSLLGPADGYNVFLFGNMYGSNSDTEGRLAAGGDIDLQNYSVGLKAGASDYSLVGGGEVRFWSGTALNGGIRAQNGMRGDNLTVEGDIATQGDVTIYSGTVQGDIVSPGTVATYTTNVVGNVVSGPVPASPVDFGAAYDQITDTSAALSAMADTGSKDVKAWGSIYLDGHDAFNVFSLTAQELADSSGILFDLADDAVAVVNVAGTYNNFSGFGFFDFDDASGEYLRMGLTTARNIFYNFYETNALDIYSIGVMGSILAPHANVYGSSGVVWGNLVATSLYGSCQFNDNSAAPVPEPATMLLFGSGIMGLFGIGRHRARRHG